MSNSIHIRCDFTRSQEFLQVVLLTNMHKHEVLGLMIQFFWYVQEHNQDGCIADDYQSLSERFECDPFFWEAMEMCGWIEKDGEMLRIFYERGLIHA